MEGRRWGSQRKDTRREFPRWSNWGNHAKSSNGPLPGVWKPTVPSWEKEYCKSVGLPWKRVCTAKGLMDMCTSESVRKWDDSAGEEAFHNAKRRYWANLNGVSCEVSLPSPDLYIDEIDWDSPGPVDSEGLDISGSESDKEDGMSYNYGCNGNSKENSLRNAGTNGWNENTDPITNYLSYLDIERSSPYVGWREWEADKIESGEGKKGTDDRGWEIFENNDAGCENKIETERNTNALENCRTHENVVTATTGWGDPPARFSKQQEFRGRNGWSREVVGDSGNQRGNYRSANKKQYFSSGKSKQLHCSVYPQYTKEPFAPRHWNAMPQAPQQRMNQTARRNSGCQLLYNNNWRNLPTCPSQNADSRRFNQSGHWKSRPEYNQGGCPVAKGRNVQWRNRDPFESGFPARNSFTQIKDGKFEVNVGHNGFV